MDLNISYRLLAKTATRHLYKENDLSKTYGKALQGVTVVKSAPCETKDLIGYPSILEPKPGSSGVPVLPSAVDYCSTQFSSTSDSEDGVQNCPPTSANDSLGSDNSSPTRKLNESLFKITNLLMKEIKESTSKYKPPTKRKIMKEKKSRGESYVTRSGIIKEAKIFKPLDTCCKKKCFERIPEEEQRKQFDYFNLIAARSDQLIADNIGIENKKVERKGRSKSGELRNRDVTAIYHVLSKGKNETVCKTLFQNTFGISKAKVDVIIGKKRATENGILGESMRGRHEPPNKRAGEHEEIIKHINSFPKYDSQCHRGHTETYLSSDLNIRKLHRLYVENRIQANIIPIKYSKYAAVFRDHGYKFKNYNNGTCRTCDLIEIKLSGSLEENEENLDRN